MHGPRHHYIPRMWLNGFSASNDGHVWYYHKDHEPKRIATSNIAVSKNFYSIGDINQDERISDAERKQLELLRKLRTDKSPNLKFRHMDILYLLILTAVRGNAYRTELGKWMKKISERRVELLKSHDINEKKSSLHRTRRGIDSAYRDFNRHFKSLYGVSFDKYIYDVGGRGHFLMNTGLPVADREFLETCEQDHFLLFAVSYFESFEPDYQKHVRDFDSEVDFVKLLHLQQIDYFQADIDKILEGLIPDEKSTFDYHEYEFTDHYLILGDHVTSVAMGNEICKFCNPAGLWHADAFFLPVSYNQLFFGNRGGFKLDVERLNKETARNSSSFFISPYDTPECREYHKLIGEKSDTASDYKIDDLILGNSEHTESCDRIHDILLKLDASKIQPIMPLSHQKTRGN